MSTIALNGESALSKREQEILGLVANGLSAKEVAGEIGIAPRTVDRHIENIRLKMRARNRVHMITQAVRAGQLRIGLAVPGTNGEFLVEYTALNAIEIHQKII